MKTMQPWTGRIVISCWLFGACLAEAGPQPGAVVAWGTCWDGSSYVPATVPAGLTNAVAAAAGFGHSLALKSNSTVVAWGYNGSGQTNVPPGLSNVVAIAAGDDHSLALQSNGLVKAWGYNYFGQTTVPPWLSNVVAIAAGGDHSLALRSNHTVVAWGYNNSGQTNVPPGLSNVVAIAAGEVHSLALRSNGTVVAWGGNYDGQTNVPLGLSNVMAIAAGADYSLALQSNGTVRAWGNYYNGEAYVPMTVPAGLSNVVAIAGGGDDALALQAKGTVVAWGMYFNGSAYVPMTAPLGLSNVAAIAGGYYHSMAITVGPEPLTLWLEPPVISLALGAATNLSASVSSRSPFGCQWSSNGVPVKGATNTNLVITNFDLTQAGLYSVAVTNTTGGYVAATTVVRLTNSPIILVDGVDVGGGTVARIDSPVQVTMSSAFGPDAQIHYTLDGSEPGFTSTPYSSAFTLTNSATLRAVAYNSTYTDRAEAAPIKVQILPTYPLLTSTPGGGSISNYPPAYTNGNRYVSGTNVTLTATPSSAWSFMHWTGDSSATTNVTTVVMDTNRVVQAVFGTSLSLSTNGHGQIILNPTSGPYPYGSSVALTALPASGWYFFGWAGAASGSNNPLSLQATPSAITALFAPLNTNQVSLTVSINGNGTVANSSFKNVYTNGETVTLTAQPATSNVFTGWSGDVSTNANPLTLVLGASKYIIANFAPAADTNPPVIIQAPPPVITPAAQASTNLSVIASSGSPLTYQWWLNGQPIAGATGTNLVITNFDLTNAGAYYVAVTNQYGYATAASVVRLTNSPVIKVDGVDVGGGTVTRIDTPVQISMTTTFGNTAERYYTLDGSAPDFSDTRYAGPFTLTNSATVRAIAYNANYTDSSEAAPVRIQIWPTYPLLTSTPGGGSISNYPAPYTNGNRYVSGANVTLTAFALTNWSFLRWLINGTNTITTNPTILSMSQSNSVQAIFGTVLNLATSGAGSGHVFTTPPNGPYPYGSNVTLIALPNSGSYFFGWAGAASGFGFANPISIQPTPSAITALFAPMTANQVSLTVSNSGSGTVTVNPFKNVYTNGETVTLTAWPATSNAFTGWSGAVSTTANPLTLVLDASKYLIASFAPAPNTNPPVIIQAPPPVITLAAQASTNLSVVVSSGSPLTCQWRLSGQPIAGATGTNLVITNFALTNAGVYSIAVTNPYGYATAASVVRLTNSPTILVDGVDVGGGTVTRVDSSVRITMNSTFGPNSAIYYTLDGSEPWFGYLYLGAFTLTNSATLRAIAYNAAYTDQAEAAPIQVQILPTYPLLTSTPGGGSISNYPAAYTNGNRYISGTNVIVTATPSTGWSFMRWVINGTTTTNNPMTLSMSQSNSVQAIFGAALDLLTNGHGQIFPNPPTGPYPYGSSVQLTALPGSDSYFYGWRGAASGFGFTNPISIQVTTARITALFDTTSANQVSLTVSNAGNGTVTISPFTNVYSKGQTVTLTAQPARTNVFTNWSGDASGTTNPLTLVLDTSKHITANFVPSTKPVITTQPASRTLGVGDSTVLSLQVDGDAPFSYQWQFNGVPLQRATNSTLLLTNFLATNAGLYSVVVTNLAGAATSSNASVALFGLETARSGLLIFPLLILDGAVGTSYQLEYTDRLVPTNWTLLDTVTLEESEGYWVDDTIGSHARRFYRAVPQ